MTTAALTRPCLRHAQLRYFQGSVMHDEDLYGAAADAADACFVLSNPDAKVRKVAPACLCVCVFVWVRWVGAWPSMLDVTPVPLPSPTCSPPARTGPREGR